ncbi:S-layer homology domain-containing protein [Lutispora sp.]|uniref:S-layer homology domain-containing protein n=1 Tax=Lutispora sp. TaxID=2828727 RepID=UPI002B1ECBE0|nr:S-layer homology domain-containing protein [Lutispora sp.]MEA4961515.1 S-layer homology domain-containing protein [Lutispora sp.]
MKYHKLHQRIIAMALSVVMLLGIMPVSAADISEGSTGGEITAFEALPKETVTQAVYLSDTALVDGKYYNQGFEALDTEPTDGTPYLHYSSGVLTVTGSYVINPLNCVGPPISINSGTLTIAGNGSLTLESEKPCVNFGTDTELVLSGGGEFVAKSTATAPVMAWGSFRTTEDYSGYIRLEGNNVVFTQMKEIDLKTTAPIDIFSNGGSSAPIVGCNGSIQMTGASITIRNKNNSISTSNGILVSAGQDVSLTATESDVGLSAKSDKAILDVGGNITLSAARGVSVYNYNFKNPGVNWKGSKFSITAPEGAAVYGQIIGIGEQPTVEIESTEGDNLQLLGGISLGSNGTCTVNYGGSITIVGYDGTKPVFSGKTLTLNANSDIIVERMDDDGSTIPVISATEQQLISRDGMVIVSGSIGSFIKTKDGQTIQVKFGGYVDHGLVLSTPPTETTFYIAGEGSILYTPAQGDNPAVLELTNATIDCTYEALILPDCPVTIELSGKNTLHSNESKGAAVTGDDSLTITSSDGGALDISSDGFAMDFYGAKSDSTITIGGNASVSATGGIAIQTSGNMTVEPTAKFSAKGSMTDVAVGGTFQAPNFNGSVAVANEAEKTHDFTIHGTCDMPGILMGLPIGNSPMSTASLHIPSGAQMTVPLGAKLMITDRSKLTLEGKIINNGIVSLPVGTKPDEITAMNLTGTGSVFVPVSIDGNGMPSPDGKFYANNGVAMTIIDSDLDLTTGDHSGKTVAVDGYSWNGSTLTLGNVLILGRVILPDSNNPITINSEKDSVIGDAIEAGSSYKCDLTFTGSGNLAIGGVFNAVGGTVTLKDGAQLVARRISFGGSGNSDSVLNVIGKGTTLTATDPHGSAISVETVNVKDSGKLIANADGIGVMAGKGGVNITGDSTLTASCTYGVYIIGGKLTMGEGSKLITNGSIAPFCIVDTTSTKEQSAVLSLAGIPSGTEIAFVKGTDSGYGYTYWSLVKTGGSLQVSNENHEPVTLTGAVQGEKLDFSKPAPPPAPTYNVMVQNDGNGTASANPTSAKQGAEITLTAAPKAGYKFKGWQVISGDVMIKDNKFTMPNGDVTVKATFELISDGNNGSNNGDSGGGSSSGGNSSGGNTSDNTKPTIPAETKPNMPTVARMSVSGTEKDGILTIHITEKMAKDAIKAAQDMAKKFGKTADGIAVEFTAGNAAGYHSLVVNIDGEAIDRFKEAGVKFVKIGSSIFDITLDTQAIAEIDKQSSGMVTVSAMKQTKLSDEAKKLIGNRPVFDITVGYQKNGKTEYVSSFGKGIVTLGIAYKAGANEKTGALYVVYVDKNGKPQLLVNSSYADGKVIFRRNSLSTYGVGYKAPAPAFTDTATHWAKDNIDFVAGRDLISGTSTTTFAPDTAITRATFLMALGKLSGEDVSGYKTSGFTDVKNTDPAMPYIEWAVKNKIVQGIGNSKFGPDQQISRQDMAVMMQNYAKATGCKLPVSVAAVTFSDRTKIAAYAKNAVTAIQQAGVMQGKGNNTFDPNGNATRAEASTILRRFLELVID